MKCYLITNREIKYDRKLKKEYINEDGKELAKETIRFAIFDTEVYTDTNNPRLSIEVLPDLKETMEKEENVLVFKSPYSASMVKKDSEQLDGSARMFTDLYKALVAAPGEGDLLLYIHGFKNDLDTALQHLMGVIEKYTVKGSAIKHVAMFTWPAMHKLLRYRSDARDAEDSGIALARAYQMLIEFFRAVFGRNPEKPINPVCNNNIHLLCHSMGNQVLKSMAKQLQADGRKVTSLFNEIVLVGSDVEWTIFEEPYEMYRLTEICQRVHVYFHNRDRALWISETTKNAYNRLGRYGFRHFEKVPAHVYSVDVSGIKDEPGLANDIIHHWYYVESPSVLQDVLEVLRGKNVEDLLKYRSAINGTRNQYRLKG